MKKFFKLPKNKTPEITLAGLFSSEFVNPLALISALYGGSLPSYKRYRENFYKDKAIDYLISNGAEIIQTAEEIQISKKIQDDEDDGFVIGEDFIIPNMDNEEGYLFFYKDNFIQLVVNDTKKDKDKCKLSFYYPNDHECISEEFHKFLVIDNSPNIFMVNQEYGQFTFSKFNINLPETFDLALNYGDDFPEINDKLIDALHDNYSGLYMLHGLPGTGKTTYIRYLASVLKKDVMFFPTSFVNEITNPAILNLLRKKQECVLILEDAEKALTKRHLSDEPSLVSTLLNMTDGILGDILKLNVIVTYNCDRQDIDEALLRKGRLKAEYSFQGLKKKHAEKLINHLDLDIEAKDNMILADIYYAKSDEKLIGNVKQLEKPTIGFR